MTFGLVQGVTRGMDNEDNFQDEIRSEGFEPNSTAPDGYTDQALNSNLKLLESPDTRNSSGAGGQVSFRHFFSTSFNFSYPGCLDSYWRPCESL